MKDNFLSMFYQKYKTDKNDNTVDSTNFLGILTFCLLFGHIVGRMGERGREFRNFIEIFSQISFRFIRWIIW